MLEKNLYSMDAICINLDFLDYFITFIEELEID